MRFPSVIALLFAVCAAASLARPGVARPAPRSVPNGPVVAPRDTIRTAVQAGEALVVALPEGGAETRYRVLEAPALSWLVDRSFFWQTLSSERGLRLVRFERHGPGAAPEVVVLAVEVIGG